MHGPVLRDFSYSLPKKVRAMGLRVALSTKLREGKLAIVDTLDVDVRCLLSPRSIMSVKHSRIRCIVMI